MFAVINSFLILGNLELAIDLMHVSKSTSAVEGQPVHCSTASKKKKYESQTWQWVWECVETIQCYTNRATAKGKSRKQDSVGAGIVFLICCSGEAGSPVSQVTGERPSITQDEVPGGAIRRGCQLYSSVPERQRHIWGISVLRGLVVRMRWEVKGTGSPESSSTARSPREGPPRQAHDRVPGLCLTPWSPGQLPAMSLQKQVPVASCPSVLLQQFLLWALLLLLWLMTDPCLFVISTPLGFCLTAILCAPLFCVTYCIRFWMSPIQAP